MNEDLAQDELSRKAAEAAGRLLDTPALRKLRDLARESYAQAVSAARVPGRSQDAARHPGPEHDR